MTPTVNRPTADLPIDIQQSAISVTAVADLDDEVQRACQFAVRRMSGFAKRPELRLDDPLLTWMQAWHDVATLHLVVAATSFVRSHCDLGLSLTVADARRQVEEALALQLAERYDSAADETTAVAQDQIVSAGRCLLNGAEAPLRDWMMTWEAMGILTTVVEAACGVSAGKSQCDLPQEELASARVYMVTPVMLGGRPTCIASGAVWHTEGAWCYAHKHSADAVIPRLHPDLAVSQAGAGLVESDTALPFRLIANAMGVNEPGMALKRLAGKVSLGLYLDQADDSLPPRTNPVYDRSEDCIDVLDSVSRLRHFDDLHQLPADRRMPGIEPATWLVHINAATAARLISQGERREFAGVARRAISPGLYMVRPCDSITGLGNLVLGSAASSLGLITDRASIITDRGGKLALLASARRFGIALPSLPGGYAARTGAAHAYVSTYRIPLGSYLREVQRDQCCGLGGALSSSETLATTIRLMTRSHCDPMRQVKELIHGLIFDCHAGSIAGAPFRFQMVFGYNGLNLATLPFWETPRSHCDLASISLFGITSKVLATEKEAFLSENNIRALGEMFGISPRELSQFSRSAQTAISEVLANFASKAPKPIAEELQQLFHEPQKNVDRIAI
jgi:hypothetical protein